MGSPAVRDPNGPGERLQPPHSMEIVRLVLEQGGVCWVHYHAGINNLLIARKEKENHNLSLTNPRCPTGKDSFTFRELSVRGPAGPG